MKTLLLFLIVFSLFSSLQPLDFLNNKEIIFRNIENTEIHCFPRKNILENFTCSHINSNYPSKISFIESTINSELLCCQAEDSSPRLLADYKCSSTTCPNGMCDTTNRCFCNDKYTTFQPEAGVQCNYRQKSRYGALLLEFFVGMEAGAGYFYLGYTGLGVGQLILFFPAMIVICVLLCCCAAAKQEKLSVLIGVFSCLWFFGSFAWWLYAVIQMGRGEITEANGAPTGESVYL